MMDIRNPKAALLMQKVDMRMISSHHKNILSQMLISIDLTKRGGGNFLRNAQQFRCLNFFVQDYFELESRDLLIHQFVGEPPSCSRFQRESETNRAMPGSCHCLKGSSLFQLIPVAPLNQEWRGGRGVHSLCWVGSVRVSPEAFWLISML